MTDIRSVQYTLTCVLSALLCCGACREPTASSPFLTVAAVDIAGARYILGEQRTTPDRCNRPHGDLRCRGQPLLWREGSVTTLADADSGVANFGAAVNADGMVVGARQPEGAAQHATVWQHGDVNDLGTFGGAWAHARAVNDRGEVLVLVGSQTGGAGMTSLVWQDGAVRELGHLGGDETEGYAIGAQGQVVGRSRTQTGEYQAFLWQDGRMTALPPLFTGTGSSSVAVVVNAAGTAAGQCVSGSGTVRAVQWRNGQVEDLGIDSAKQLTVVDINDTGQILIAVTNPSGVPLGYLWHNGMARLIAGDGGQSLEFVGLSAAGEVAGSERREDGSYQAFRWHNDVLERLGTLGGRSSQALAISADGMIVGESNLPAGDLRGFQWDGTMQLLETPTR